MLISLKDLPTLQSVKSKLSTEPVGHYWVTTNDRFTFTFFKDKFISPNSIMVGNHVGIFFEDFTTHTNVFLSHENLPENSVKKDGVFEIRHTSNLPTSPTMVIEGALRVGMPPLPLDKKYKIYKYVEGGDNLLDALLFVDKSHTIDD
jgi:hypothetical protein